MRWPCTGGRARPAICMQEYMQQAAALIHSYVPPQPQQIQAAKDGGRVAVNPQPGGKARIEMKQYLKPGDLTG